MTHEQMEAFEARVAEAFGAWHRDRPHHSEKCRRECADAFRAGMKLAAKPTPR